MSDWRDKRVLISASPLTGVGVRKQGQGMDEDGFEPLRPLPWIARYEALQLIVERQHRQPVNNAPGQKRAGVAHIALCARRESRLCE